MKSLENKDLLSGNLVLNIIKFTLPIIFSSILQLLFNAADLVVVGKFDLENGSAAQAAIGSTTALIGLIVNFFLGLSIGVNVIVAQMIGAKDTKNLKAAVQTSMMIGTAAGIVIMTLGSIFAKPMLSLMSTDPAVLPLAADYLEIYFFGTPFAMIYNFGSSVLRASGETRKPMIFLTVAGVINVILNLFTVIVLDMGVRGVAIATSVSNLISGTLIVISLVKTDTCVKLVIKGARFNFNCAKKILGIGITAGLQSSMFSISNVLIQSSVNSFGATVMAGNSIAMSIEGFIYVAMNAFSAAAITFVGQCCGAENYKLLNRVAVTVPLLAAATGIVFGWGAYFLRDPLAHIYSSNEADIEKALIRMTVICLTYFTCGLMDSFTGLIRGMGYSLAPMAVSVAGVCLLRIVWIYTVFRLDRTLTTLYISYPVSWILTFLALVVCFFCYKRKLTKNNINAVNNA